MKGGIDFVLPSDYDALVVARQQELAHIAEQLAIIENADVTDTRAYYIRDLIRWIEQRRACLQVKGAQTYNNLTGE
jgi:hypothetical protein